MLKKLNQDVIISVLILVISLFFLVMTFSMPKEASTYPLVLLCILILFSIITIFSSWNKTHEEKNVSDDEEIIKLKNLKSPLIIFGISFIYVALISFLGFFIASTIFLVTYLYYKKIKNWKLYLGMVVGFNLFVYIVFFKQLNVPLPLGIFIE